MYIIIVWGVVALFVVGWIWSQIDDGNKHAEQERKKKQQQALEWERQKERREQFLKELEELRKTPTSSKGSIRGRRIARQIKMVAVDDHRSQDSAEYDFFKQVQSCGANGVINMKVRRARGGYISIQGDAVVLE